MKTTVKIFAITMGVLTLATVSRAALIGEYRADAGVTTNGSGFVSSWQNLGTGGAAFNATQGTGAAQPQFLSSGFGEGGRFPLLRFDGIDDFLSAASMFSGSVPRTIFASYRVRLAPSTGVAPIIGPASPSSAQMWFEMDARDGNNPYLAGFARDTASGHANDYGIVGFAGAGFDGGGAELLTWKFTGETFGSASTSAGPLNTSTSPFLFGGGNSAGNFGPVDLFEVRVYNTFLDASQQQSILSEMQDAVPEPSAALLLLVGGSLMWRRKKIS